jgi:hypothetical protein
LSKKVKKKKRTHCIAQHLLTYRCFLTQLTH